MWRPPRHNKSNMLSIFLIIKIADTEIGRKEKLGQKLEYICRQLEQLKVVEALPKGLELQETVINRALDIRSASMICLGRAIIHHSIPLGTTGISSFDRERSLAYFVRSGGQRLFCWRSRNRGLRNRFERVRRQLYPDSYQRSHSHWNQNTWLGGK